MEMNITKDDVVVAVRKTACNMVVGVSINRLQRKFAAKHGMKRTVRYMDWCVKPKTLAVNFAVAVSLQLLAVEIDARVL